MPDDFNIQEIMSEFISESSEYNFTSYTSVTAGVPDEQSLNAENKEGGNNF